MAVDEGPSPVRERRSSFGGGVMLLIGLVVGFALAAAAGVFLLGIGWATPVESRVVIFPSVSPNTPPSQSPAVPSATGSVPEPCARSARYNIEVDKGIDDLARSAQSNDARAIQEALDRLQDARDKAKGAAQQCLALGDASGASPSGSAQPSASQSTSTQPSASPTR